MEKINADLIGAKQNFEEDKQSLNSSQQLIQTIIDSIDGEVFIKDKNGKYLYVNKAFGENFGVDPNDVIGRDDFFIFPPEGAEMLQKNDRQIIVGKKSVNIEESGFVNGQYVTYLTNKVPLIGKDGEVFGICGVGINITRQKEMEEELRASKKKYQDLVKFTHDIVYSVTPDGTITFAGPQIERFGYAPGDLISRNFIEFVAPEQRDEVVDSFEKGSKNKSSSPTEFQFVGRDGKRNWVEAVGKILYDDHGNPLIQIGVLRDIEERKRLETILKESEKKYRDLYDSAPDMFVSVDAKTAKIIECNQTFVSLLGYAKAEIIGRSVFDIYTPESAEHAKKNVFPGFLKTGKVQNEEMQIQLKNGSKMDATLNESAVYDEQGNILYSRSILRDITKRKEMEGALKKAHIELERKVKERTAELSETVTKLQATELQYRTLADFAYDWEYWENIDGTLRYVSPSCERISGYAPKQFIDKPSLFREIILPEDRNAWDDHSHDSRLEFIGGEIQVRIQTCDGQIRWIEHVCQPVIDKDGKLSSIRASNRDITERKNDEIKLQKAFAEIKKLKTQLEADSIYLSEEIKLQHNYENIIGNSNVLQYVIFRAEQVAPTEATVLIMGETGTGKELIARMIHKASTRNERPLIKVDCASLPENLIESELFGHEKGAFTSAGDRRMGRFELADGATLFLDEIGELPLGLQSKLLRVLQDGEFERLGSSTTLRTDVRIIAATNRDLEEEVRKKKFRMDLFYRLNVFTITIPPLRDRKEDIILLINFMIKKLTRKHGKEITKVHSKVLDLLQNYNWPGNIRELENVIERAVINSQSKTLHLESIQQANNSENASESIDQPMKSLKKVEQEHILNALKLTNWRIHGQDGAAALLDINPNTLRGRMRKYGIKRPQ